MIKKLLGKIETSNKIKDKLRGTMKYLIIDMIINSCK